MKKVITGIALAGAVSSLSAADIAANDAAFLFGHDSVNVVAMSSAEMVQTEGQLLGILDPVLGLVGGLLGGLPVGPILDSALPVNVALGVQAGTLLDLGLGLHLDSSLPTLLGGLT
ncbi:MAG: hypothetical protein P8Y51_07930, partial [Campylobacterales bacterium]